MKRVKTNKGSGNQVTKGSNRKDSRHMKGFGREYSLFLLALCGLVVFWRLWLLNVNVKIVVQDDHQRHTPLHDMNMEPQSGSQTVVDEEDEEEEDQLKQEADEDDDLLQKRSEKRLDDILKDKHPMTVLVSAGAVKRSEKIRESISAYNDWVETHYDKKRNFVYDKVKNKVIERYFTKGYWFNTGEKYFVYQPSGGMSNQRIILEQAILVAKALNRILVVPPIGPHTSMFWNYNKVDWDRTVEAFTLFEKDKMEQAVPVIGLSNCILRRFVEFNENLHGQSWRRIQRERARSVRGAPWTTKDVVNLFGNVTEDVLFFAQYTMWKGFKFTDEEEFFAEQHVQLNNEMRHVARIIPQRLFGLGVPYHGLHIRFEDRDAQVITDVLGPASSFVRRLNRVNSSDITNQLYIATQPKKIHSTYFQAFRKAGYELHFSTEFLEFPEVKTLLAKYPSTDVGSSVLGLLEQLVCARSFNFLGTGFSTFSRYIRLMRNSPLLFFDENLLPERYTKDAYFLASYTFEDIEYAFNRKPLKRTEEEEKEISYERYLIQRNLSCSRDAVSTKLC